MGDSLIDVTYNRTVGLASFTLQISDNDDLDGDPLVDSDNIIFLTSTANYPARNDRSTIRTMVQYTGPSGYAQEHYNSRNEGVSDSGDVVNTQRW